VTPDRILAERSSTILCGDDRPLLNWVAYAMAMQTDPEFVWTDVRVPGQELNPTDLLAQNLVPSSRFRVLETSDLIPNDAAANVGVSAVIRSDETPTNVQRLLDFLRLPTETQRMIEGIRASDRPRVAVLSNGHRVLAHYASSDTTARTIRAITDSGVTFIMTFADDRPKGRFVFDNVLDVDGRLADGWRQASFMVEKWPIGAPFATGSKVRLVDFLPVASVLESQLG